MKFNLRIALLLLSGCSLLPEYLHAQYKLDSLQTRIANGRRDTHQIKTMMYLGREYQQLGKMDSLWENAVRIIELSKQLNFPKGQAVGLHHQGIYYYYTDSYPEAISKYEEALRICESSGNIAGAGNSFNNLGLVYNNLSQYDKALEYYTKALEAYSSIRDTSGMLRCYNNIGIVHDNQGQYPKALEYYYKSLAICDVKQDKAGQANLYLNIGLVHTNQGEHEEAMKNYEEALRLGKEMDYKQVISNAYGNMAIALRYLEQYDRAMQCNDESIRLEKSLNNRRGLASSFNTRGKIYRDMHQPDAAMSAFLDAKAIFEEIKDSVHLGITLGDIANLHYQKQQYAKAIDYFHRAREIASNIQSPDDKLSANQGLAMTYAAMKDFKNAYFYQQEYQELNDTLFNERKSEQIADIAARYEAEKKDTEIQLLQADRELHTAEIQKQKLLKYLFFGGLISTLILAWLLYRHIRTRNELRVQTLRNKIARDLHDDVGSTLSSIAIFSDMARDQSRDLEPLLNSIGEGARKMLDAMGDIVWTIHPDNDQFDRMILRMRTFAFELLGAKNIEFTFETGEHIPENRFSMEMRKNLFLIFKEATNNLAKYSGANKAAISLRDSKEGLMLMVRDNGKGFQSDQIQEGSGLRNMRQRAKEMGAELQIDSDPGVGTTIRLTIPV